MTFSHSCKHRRRPPRNATVINEPQIASGELCYLLNQGDDQAKPAWHQTLGKDFHPVLDSTHANVTRSPDGTYINEDDETSIASFRTDASSGYSVMGLPIGKSQKGIHILRNPDGTTRKVVIN